MPSLRIRTPGYWPLPPFVQFHDGKKWAKLKLEKRNGEKEAEYQISGPKPVSFHPASSILILEASITKALPKKIHLFVRSSSASRPIRFVLSRWIGGLYSNLRASSPQRQVRSFYDSIAPRYKYHVEPGRAHQLAVFLDFISKDSKVLDASAGDCTFAKAAKKERKDLDVFCSDLSEGMLALGAGVVPSSHLAVSSASRLPFPPASFDVVLHSFSNLHPSDKTFFRSFARALKPGGALLYHPVKAPGEQWPPCMKEKTEAALRAAGFAKIERLSANSNGPKKSTLVFYLARK
ncbi:Ubiquinone/menaquinone biosynthesis C-methyltransferase UbiE [uncultured archaeon]|nr:Ubiquinone/menaquinone biosynthesis C-methyltransferase UbiE [uncultured archaeon]